MEGARLDLPSRPAGCCDQLHTQCLETLCVGQCVERQPHIPTLLNLGQPIAPAILSEGPQLPLCSLGNERMDRVDSAGVDVEWEQVRAASDGRRCGEGDLAMEV